MAASHADRRIAAAGHPRDLLGGRAAVHTEHRPAPDEVPGGPGRQSVGVELRPVGDAEEVGGEEPDRRALQETGLGHQVLRQLVVDAQLLELEEVGAERVLRAVVPGRKGFLFAGSDAGGDRAAAIYSLIGSAKLNGLDPEAYLRFVIARIADYRINELDDLLPWRVAEQIANTEHHAAA